MFLKIRRKVCQTLFSDICFYLELIILKVINISTLTCAGNAVNAGSEVLDDGHGASLDGQDAGQLEDDVLGAGPAAQITIQLDPRR